MNIKPETKVKLNDPELIAHRDMWFERLSNVFDGKEDDFNQEYVMTFVGCVGHCPDDQKIIHSDPESWVVQCLDDLAAKVDKCKTDVQFIVPCIEGSFYGVHFSDKILGADIRYKSDMWYANPLKIEIGTLQPVDLANNPTWQLAQRVALKFVEQDVKLPLFGLPTIASVLNVGINLLGEDLLASMITDPEAARHDLKIINDTLCEMHRWYREVIPMQQLQPVLSFCRTQPPGYGQICGCSTQLISSELYREMIQPLDEELLGVYPNGGMIHLCGSSSHLIPNFREMKNLKSFQINNRSAKDLELYFNGLRKDQIIYLDRYEEMTLQQGLDITGGERLVIPSYLGERIRKNTK